MPHASPEDPALGSTVLVVGGANTDIVGVPERELLPGDSAPGHVRRSPGGVGRNIAENLARMGVSARLLSAFGSDANGAALARECRSVGIDTTPSLAVDDVPGSIYLAILDANGDLAFAVNDMRAVDRLTVAVLGERRHQLSSAGLVVIDTNLPTATIEWIAENATSPLLVDATSCPKAPKVLGVLPLVHTLKLSALEAGTLVGRDLQDESDAETAAGELLALGVRRVFITLGARGAIAADGMGCIHVPAPRVDVVDVTGAGDAFSAGIALSMLRDMPLAGAAALGSAMAALVLSSDRTVSESINLEVVTTMAKELAL